MTEMDRLIARLAELGVTTLFQIAEEVLSEKEWYVFQLHFQEGFSQRQIAQASGLPRSTVQSRIKSATDRVASEFKMREAA